MNTEQSLVGEFERIVSKYGAPSPQVTDAASVMGGDENAESKVNILRGLRAILAAGHSWRANFAPTRDQRGSAAALQKYKSMSKYLALETKNDREFATAHARWLRRHADRVRPTEPKTAGDLDFAATELEAAILQKEQTI